MLDTAGKILEQIIHGRIEEVTDKQLSVKQFGFRQGRSTFDAIDQMVKTAKEATSGKMWKDGENYCLVVALDIKNAFKSPRWNRIMESLERMKVPEYLRKIVVSYLSDRIKKYDTEEGQKEYRITGVVPQGSVLGPLLWNIMYHELLQLKLPRAVTPVEFADDVTLVIVGKHLEDLSNLFSVSSKKYQDFIGQELAEHKTGLSL